jgi:hypothetical protein
MVARSLQTRYLDIHEGDPLDEAQFAAWVKQAGQFDRPTIVSGQRGSCVA